MLIMLESSSFLPKPLAFYLTQSIPFCFLWASTLPAVRKGSPRWHCGTASCQRALLALCCVSWNFWLCRHEVGRLGVLPGLLLRTSIPKNSSEAVGVLPQGLAATLTARYMVVPHSSHLKWADQDATMGLNFGNFLVVSCSGGLDLTLPWILYHVLDWTGAEWPFW